MSKSRLILLVIGLLFVSGFFAVRQGMDFIEKQIIEKSAEKGVQLGWESLNWHWSGVSLDQVRGKHARGEFVIEQVEVKLDHFNWIGKRPRIRSVHMLEPHLTLRRNGKTKEKGAMSAAESPSGYRLKRLYDLGIDGVQVTGGGFKLINRGTTVVDIEILDGVFDWADGLPRLMVSAKHKSLYTGAGTLRASINYRPEETHQTVYVEPLVETEPLLQLNLGGHFMRLGRLRLAINSLDLSRSKLSLYETGISTNQLDVDLTETTISGSLAAPAIMLANGRVRLKTPRKKRQAKTERAHGKGATEKLPRVRLPGKLLSFIEKGGLLSWQHLTVEKDGLPKVVLAKGRLGIDWVKTDIAIAGGTAAIELDWEGYTGIPQTLFWEAKNINLKQLLDAVARWKPEYSQTRMGLDGRLSSTGVATILGDGLDDLRQVVTQTTVGVSDGRIELAPLSPQPITDAQGEITITGSYDRLLKRSNPTFKFKMGVVDLTLDITYIGYGRKRYFNIKGGAEPMDCQAAIDSLPNGVLGAYKNVKLSGQMKPWLKFKWPLHFPSQMRTYFGGIIQHCSVDALNARKDAWPNVTFARGDSAPLDDVDWLKKKFILKLNEGVYGGRELVVGPGTRSYIKIGGLPSHVGGAAYLSEEVLFPRNQAIDRGLISRAIRLNLINGRFVYGGSTVTQQLVKNLFLTRDKSIARKVQEVLIAKRITQELSRNRVLELYLNCIEFGHNLYGIGKAARHYFQKSAWRLRPRESIFLALIKPSPRAFTSIKYRGSTPRGPYWEEKSEIVLQRMLRRGMVTPEMAERDRPLAIKWVGGRYVEPVDPPKEKDDATDTASAENAVSDSDKTDTSSQ
ncbi:MAG: biosynthetic peptidoglycan transglycosylase [Myxococcota bacterium]|nr:biosynthetic peptidoglycan transglycosylase [Myxococcota bacterium]